MSSSSNKDSDTGKVAEESTVEIFTGISQTLFALGPHGLREVADAWESLTEVKTTGKLEEKIKALESEREVYDKGFGESLAKLMADSPNDYDTQATLFRNRAVYHKALDDKIQVARLIPSSEAYVEVAKKHGLPHRTPSGNSGSSITDSVWKVNRYKEERYYVVTEDSVTTYAVDKDQGADLVVTLSEESFPNIYKSITSASALGKLHDMLYVDSKKAFASKEARLKAFEPDPTNWYLKVGRSNDTSNGVNNMVNLETEPDVWLESNLPKEEEEKK